MQRKIWPVDKDWFLSWMAMNIDKWGYWIWLFSILNDLWDHSLYCTYCWVELDVWSNKLSVQVIAREWCSVVADNYSIWISHRDYFKDDSLSEFYCFKVGGTGDKVYEALHNIGSIGLARMHSGANNYVFLELVEWHLVRWTEFLWVYLFKVLSVDSWCNSHHWNI